VKKRLPRKKRQVRKKITSFWKYLFAALCFGILAFSASWFRASHYCANSISCIKDLSNQVENGAVGIFAGHQVIAPPIDLTLNSFQPTILGTADPNAPKHIYVDLTNQTVTAYQGDTLVLKALIASGKWAPTPTGEFSIWIKVRSQRMSGGEGADYYNLPNVPFVMFFAGGNVAQSRGFSLHGAYWHNNFGHPMSHGCVNMRQIDAEVLYNWADPPTVGTVTRASGQNPGTPVTVFGTIPES
jgi:hypothetical protein